MSIQRKTPDAGCTAYVEGPSNSSFNIYTPSQLISQGMIARRHGISLSHARVVTSLLTMGGRS